MSNKDMDYYLEPEHADEFDKLTPDEKAEVFTASEGNSSYEEPVVEPTEEELKAAGEAKAAEEAGKKAEEDKPSEDDKPVIQARDGKNVIPYEKLEEARTEAKDAQEKIDRLEQTVNEKTQLVTDLQEAAKKDAEADDGTTAAQDEVKAKYEGEYPEMMDDIGPHVEKLIQEGSASVVQSINDQIEALKADLAPVKETVEQDAAAVEAADKADWSKAQVDFMDVEKNRIFDKDTRPVMFNLLNKEVIALYEAGVKFVDYPDLLAKAKQNVIDSVSISTGQKLVETVKKDEKDLQAEADKKLKDLKDQPPASLSDVPGSAVITDEAEVAANMGMRQANTKFSNMDADQIEDYLGRVGL